MKSQKLAKAILLLNCACKMTVALTFENLRSWIWRQNRPRSCIYRFDSCRAICARAAWSLVSESRHMWMSHVNESCHIRKSHIWRSYATYKSCRIWVMSHMSRVTCPRPSHMGFGDWVTAHMNVCMNEPWHIWMSHVIYEAVMAHVRLSHMNESCSLVISHMNVFMNESSDIWISHVTYEWVMSRMKQSCHMWGCHIWMSHVAKSCHTWRSHVTYE